MEVPDEWESRGSGANAPRLLAPHTYRKPRAAATCPTGCQAASQLRLPSLFHSTTSYQLAQVLTKPGIQVIAWEINIWLGRGKALDTHDLPNPRASKCIPRNRATPFRDNHGCDPKCIQNKEKISVPFSCLWASRLHPQHLELFTVCGSIGCTSDKLPTKP